MPCLGFLGRLHRWDMECPSYDGQWKIKRGNTKDVPKCQNLIGGIVLTQERIREIFNEQEDKPYVRSNEDRMLPGLVILSKYTKDVIQAAEHDIIYSMDIEDAIERGITEEEVIKLAESNWMVDEDNGCFAHFV